MLPTASALLSIATRATGRRAWLVVPLVVGETLIWLFGLLPVLVVGARAYKLADEDWNRFPLALFRTFGESEVLWTAAYALLFASVLGWLVRALLHAGALGTLAQAMTDEGEDDRAFSNAILRGPERWIASAAATTLLRGFVFVTSVGSVAAGMVFFVERPGPWAAFMMTVATALVLVGPLLLVALELAFARTVILGEGPIDAIAQAILQAARRRRALIPAWFGLVLLGLLIAVVQGYGATILDGSGDLASDPSFHLLLLGPQAFWALCAAAATSLLLLLRLSLYAALAVETTGRLSTRPPALPRRPPPVFVFEAVVVSDGATRVQNEGTVDEKHTPEG